MNSQKSDLPEFCALFDELISEIAKERGCEAQEVKERIIMSIQDTQS